MGAAESKEGLRPARLWQNARETQEFIRVMGRANLKRRESGAKRLDVGVEIKAREGSIDYVPRMAVVEKLNSVSGELKKLRESH